MQKSNNLRKSNRKPTPNIKYADDIHELIKESADKKKVIDHKLQHHSSFSQKEELNAEQERTKKSDEHTLTCIFGNGTIKNVQIIFSCDAKLKQRNERVVSQKVKNSPSRLLILFKQVIENLSNSDVSNHEQQRKSQILRIQGQAFRYDKVEYANYQNKNREDGLLKIKFPQISTNLLNIKNQKQKESDKVGSFDENSYDRINLI